MHISCNIFIESSNQLPQIILATFRGENWDKISKYAVTFKKCSEQEVSFDLDFNTFNKRMHMDLVT